MTGYRQTLDISHAAELIAKAGQRHDVEWTAQTEVYHEHGRDLLLSEGWKGMCRLIGEDLGHEDSTKRRGVLDRLLGYFASHISQLDYARPVGSGKAISSGVVDVVAKTMSVQFRARSACWRHRIARVMPAPICCMHTDQSGLFCSRTA